MSELRVDYLSNKNATKTAQVADIIDIVTTQLQQSGVPFTQDDKNKLDAVDIGALNALKPYVPGSNVTFTSINNNTEIEISADNTTYIAGNGLKLVGGTFTYDFNTSGIGTLVKSISRGVDGLSVEYTSLTAGENVTITDDYTISVPLTAGANISIIDGEISVVGISGGGSGEGSNIPIASESNDGLMSANHVNLLNELYYTTQSGGSDGTKTFTIPPINDDNELKYVTLTSLEPQYDDINETYNYTSIEYFDITEDPNFLPRGYGTDVTLYGTPIFKSIRVLQLLFDNDPQTGNKVSFTVIVDNHLLDVINDVVGLKVNDASVPIVSINPLVISTSNPAYSDVSFFEIVIDDVDADSFNTQFISIMFEMDPSFEAINPDPQWVNPWDDTLKVFTLGSAHNNSNILVLESCDVILPDDSIIYTTALTMSDGVEATIKTQGTHTLKDGVSTQVVVNNKIDLTYNNEVLDGVWNEIIHYKYKAGANISILGDVISATDTTYNAATDTSDGLLSAADKDKLDNIEEGATKNSAGVNISIDNTGEISATDTTYDVATDTSDGLLSAADKIIIDTIINKANKLPDFKLIPGVSDTQWDAGTNTYTLENTDSNMTLWVSEDCTIILPGYDAEFSIDIAVKGNKVVSIECTGSDTFKDETTTTYDVKYSGKIVASPDSNVWCEIGNFE